MAHTMSGPDALRHFEAKALDMKAIGFRCGLEIHQQLDTGKLFSRVPSQVLEPDELPARTIAVVDRKLRATGSESGEVDVAARAEADKGLTFRYLAQSGLASLIELDDEPPAPMDKDALDVALTFSGLLGSRPVDEVHVMRKTVIDGSNTSGFQRTALVASGGWLDVEGGDVGVWLVSLEEDSARKLEADEAAKAVGDKAPKREGVVSYTLDRLGIPLIEIATAPDVKDPQHAQKTAARIGALLRATGRVKRGLGTIRQDLNVSVAVGERVEIKGCQDLRAIPRVIEAECRRQLWMHHIREQLAARHTSAVQLHVVDVTQAFEATAAKSVKEAITKGQKVLGLKLAGFAGLLKGAAKDAPRLGRELADHAKVAAGVKGLFHSDELPNYGITEGEVAAVRATLQCAAPDAFALVVESPTVAQRALAAVAARANQALGPAVKEVRAAQPDDSTRFMRPMPGAARMYPETDVPPIRITKAAWKRITSHLPPKPEEKVKRLAATGLSADLAGQLVADGSDGDYEVLVRSGADGALAARVLLQVLPTLTNAAKLLPKVPELFAQLKAGRFAKEAVPDLLSAWDKDPTATLDTVIAAAGAGAADTATVDSVIAKVIAERADFVKSKGMAAMGPLMGPVMAELRGKADGQLISARLKAALEKAS